MEKLNSCKKSRTRNNILTIALCVLVVIFVGFSFFLSKYDWHYNSALSGLSRISAAAKNIDKLPKSAEKRDWDYFDDTVFVGDSITYGVASYNYLSYDHVFAKVGLSQSSALKSKCVYTSKTNSYTIAEALKIAKPGKVILTIGINAIYGYKTESFYNNYRALVKQIKEATPDSTIIIQSILPVTSNWAKNNNKPKCNQNIAYANNKIYEIAKSEGCYFLYTFEALCDDEGFLLHKYSGDGIHLSQSGYETLFNYILSHAVSSSGKFTKIGAIRPPVVYSSTSSKIVMPEFTNTESHKTGDSDDTLSGTASAETVSGTTTSDSVTSGFTGSEHTDSSAASSAVASETASKIVSGSASSAKTPSATVSSAVSSIL